MQIKVNKHSPSISHVPYSRPGKWRSLPAFALNFRSRPCDAIGIRKGPPAMTANGFNGSCIVFVYCVLGIVFGNCVLCLGIVFV